MKKYAVMTGLGVLLVASYGVYVSHNTCMGLVKEPVNLGVLKIEVRKYHDDGSWQKSIECTVEKAKQILQNYTPAPGEKPAVVFDIDETSLSNWQNIDALDFGYNPAKYKEWENSAQDTAIEPIKELYDVARAKKFAIFFISGRREVQRKFVERNLDKVGFTHWDGVFLKPMDYVGNRAMEHKSKWRAHIKQMGYHIILNIGDQWSDLEGEPHAIYDMKIANPAYFIP